MGIPYFFREIYKKYYTIVLYEENVRVDCVYFDFNSLIHPCINSYLQTHEQFTEEDLINSVVNYTWSIIKKFDYPYLKEIMISIDGIPPLAKIKQQRERRYKSFFSNSKKWDTNNITTGTPFMKKLKVKLDEFFTFLKDDGIKYISDDNHGEAEHKIKAHILKNATNLNKICIYGLDADLIILSLMTLEQCNGKKEIMLLRDNDNEINYMKIDLLYNLLQNRFGSKMKDFCFSSFLLGNDFLHNLPSLHLKNNGMNHIINGIIEMGRNCIINDDYTINSENLLTFLKILQKTEGNIKMKSCEKNEDNQLIKYITFDGILKCKSYYIYYNINNIQKCVKEYLQTLYWNWNYYCDYKNIDWEHVYTFENVPYIIDIISYYPQQKIKVCSKNNMLTQEEQLLLVLPYDSLNYIIGKEYNKFNEFVKFLNKGSNGIFLKNLNLDIYNKEYLWQSSLFEKNNIKRLLYQIRFFKNLF